MPGACHGSPSLRERRVADVIGAHTAKWGELIRKANLRME